MVGKNEQFIMKNLFEAAVGNF